jgi:hypothetical protein
MSGLFCSLWQDRRKPPTLFVVADAATLVADARHKGLLWNVLGRPRLRKVIVHCGDAFFRRALQRVVDSLPERVVLELARSYSVICGFTPRSKLTKNPLNQLCCANAPQWGHENDSAPRLGPAGVIIANVPQLWSQRPTIYHAIQAILFGRNYRGAKSARSLQPAKIVRHGLRSRLAFGNTSGARRAEPRS